MKNAGKTIIILLAVMVLAAFSGFPGETRAVHPLNGHQDEGKFTYYVNEELVGTSRSKWNADGSFENNSTITMAGQTINNTLKIAVDKDGLWTEITMSTPKGPAVIKRTGAAVAISIGSETSPVPVEPGSLIMEDMSPALMSQAVAAYDQQRGGEQKFPLYFIPVMSIQASLEYGQSFQKKAGDGLQTFRQYRYKMPPIYEVNLVVDQTNRVCLAEYPAQKGLFVREGYEFLRSGKDEGGIASAPEYEVLLEKNVDIPMKDGVRLSTDIFRPGKEGKYPVILVRTPYKKEMNDLQARFYTRRGYVFAVQDVRGRFASPGEWRPIVHEADDGYDTIEWLAAQPWSSGKVGLIGASYLGWVQWLAASRRPPHLAAMIPNVSPPEAYFNFPHENGALMLTTSLWWANMLEQKATADITGLAMQESFTRMDQKKLMHLPVIELDETLYGRKIPFWREWIDHPDYDLYWQKLAYLNELKTMDIPVYHQSGWYDGDGIGAKLNYLGMVGYGHKNQKLVLGPWAHTDGDNRFDMRGMDWGPKAQVNLQADYLKWFDRWLKGIDNRIDKEPRVSLFVMGANDWVQGDQYPLETTEMTRFYLASEGDAGGGSGRGCLITDAPTAKGCSPDRYTYDPGDPTGFNPEGRQDVLVYQTPVAERPFTIAGPMSAVLYASSSAKDTDWVLRLARITSEGQPIPLSEGCGVVRARYRESFSQPKLLEPGKIYEYKIDLWQTGVTIGRGERLMLVVSSALFPKFNRNLNTGGHNERETRFVKAEQTIYHDAGHPSHVLLPILNMEKQSKWMAGHGSSKSAGATVQATTETKGFENAQVLDEYTGRFQIRPGFVVTVSREGNKLMAEATGQPKSELIPKTGRMFLIADIQAPITFVADDQGQVTHFLLEQGGMKIQAWKPEFTRPASPPDKKEIKLTPAILDSFAGNYRLDPNHVFTITREGNQLFVQLTEQPKLEVYAESETVFFYKSVDAQITFVKDKTGHTTHLVLHQNGMDIQADRI